MYSRTFELDTLYPQIYAENVTTRGVSTDLSRHMKAPSFPQYKKCFQVSSQLVKDILDLVWYQSGYTSFRNFHRVIDPFSFLYKTLGI